MAYPCDVINGCANVAVYREWDPFTQIPDYNYRCVEHHDSEQKACEIVDSEGIIE